MAKQQHRTISTSAPIGGLNVRDAIQDMSVKDALELVNWIPQQYGVRCRKGYKEWAINMSTSVQSIMAYSPSRASAASAKLFAATDSNIYDITNSTNAPASVQALSGATNAGRFYSVMMANSAGTFLAMCQETGGYRYYDGAAWTSPPAGAGAGQVNGVAPTVLCFVNQWKRRLWFIERGTANLWYAPVDSLTGTFAKLDVGPLLPHGGVVSFIANWTIDAGEGIDDFLVIGGENGDVLVYKGTDPASATTFALQGRWYVGRLPVGRRCFTTLGGDLLVISENGLQPLSYVTRGGQSLLRASSVDYLAKIQPRFADLAQGLIDTYGWELNYSQAEGLLIVNVPPGSTSVYTQYALYTNTNKWCSFSGMSVATSSATSLGYYFGDSGGKVHLAFTGYFDAVAYGASTGNGILGSIQTAYSYFGLPGQNKQFLMARPTFLATDQPGCVVTMFADYASVTSTDNPIYGTVIGSAWDVSKWDAARWSGSLNKYSQWYGVSAIGYTGSISLRTGCVGDTFLVSIDYMVEQGGEI